jgi:ligand-binding sensor domain-containing protein
MQMKTNSRLLPAMLCALAVAFPAKAQHATPHAQPREGKVAVDLSKPFTHFRVGNRNVKSIYSEGTVVWVGTSGGVVRYDTKTEAYKLYDNKNGLLSNGVFWVGRLRGRITVGTYGGGLSILDEKDETWQTFNVPDGLGDAFVYEVMETRGGDVWIATWSGANRVRGGELRERGKWDLYTVENTKGGLPNDWVYGLAEGKNGEIWLATEGGLARFHKGKWDNWNHAKGQGAPYEKVKNAIAYKSDPSQVSTHHARQKEEMGLQNIDVAYNPNYIVAMEVDAQGSVWVGTWGGGLGRFDGKKWKNYTTAEGLHGNHVFLLHIDRRGDLWVGTNNGLGRMLNGRFEKPMTTAQGLYSNTVFSMANADDGSLWIGSYGGVTRLKSPGR